MSTRRNRADTADDDFVIYVGGRPPAPYFEVPHDLWRVYPGTSLKAWGLLVILMSLQAEGETDISAVAIAKRVKDRRDSILGAFNELRDLGLVYRRSVSTPSGPRWVTGVNWQVLYELTANGWARRAREAFDGQGELFDVPAGQPRHQEIPDFGSDLVRSGFPGDKRVVTTTRRTTKEEDQKRGAGLKVTSPAPNPAADAVLSRIARDWQPDDSSRAYAVEAGLDPDVVAEGFRDYFLASGRPQADWQARFRSWCRDQAARDQQATEGGFIPDNRAGWTPQVPQ